MICPVEIAHDMSALRAVRMGDHAEHGSLSEGRDGAGDESTGRDVAGDGEEDHVVAGGGDSGHQRSAHAAVAGALRGRGLQRVAGPAAGQALASPSAGGDGGESVWGVPGKYFGLNVQHFHEKLQAEHGIEVSYTWVKQALQGAGLVERGGQGGGARWTPIAARKWGGRCRSWECR